MHRILSLLFVLALLPTGASALTVQEVVTLSKAGVSDDVLMAMIDRDKTIFAIDASQLIALKRDGVSERIVIALLKSGREEPPPAPAPSPAFVPNEPTLVMVGHGPERPNTYHSFDRLDYVGSPVFLYSTPGPFAYQTPYAVGVGVTPWLRGQPPCTTGHRVASGARKTAEPANCRRSR
jgi:hypothetical protein